MKKIFFWLAVLSTSSSSAQVDSLGLKNIIQQQVDALLQVQAQKKSNLFLLENSHLISDSKTYNIRISERSKISWKNSGIKYIKGQGANLGVSSFCIIDDSLTAYLSKSTSEVILLSENNNILSRFSVPPLSGDIFYDKKTLYVLGQSELYLFSTFGAPINTLNISEFLNFGVETMFRKKDTTFFQLSSGLNVPIENAKHKIALNNFLHFNNGIGLSLLNDTTYIFSLPRGTATNNYEIATKRKIAAVYEVFHDSLNVVIDEQLFEKESPIEIQRNLVWISFREGVQMKKQRIPKCYYVQMERDFLFDHGKLYHMIAAPDAIYLFQLSFGKYENSNGYPITVSNCNYHYNYHLLKENTKASYEIQNQK